MSASDSSSLNSNDVFEILSNPRRRMVLHYLRKHDDDVGVRELAKQIASMENELPVDELTSQQRKRVYVSLYQTHLPKMAQMNAIEYDKDAGVVRLTSQTSTIDHYLTNGEQADYPWTYHYLVLAGLSVTVLTLSVLDVSIFTMASTLWFGLAALAMFAVSGIIQRVIQARDTDIPFELSQHDN